VSNSDYLWAFVISGFVILWILPVFIAMFRDAYGVRTVIILELLIFFLPLTWFAALYVACTNPTRPRSWRY
jgi:hypothetical protein